MTFVFSGWDVFSTKTSALDMVDIPALRLPFPPDPPCDSVEGAGIEDLVYYTIVDLPFQLSNKETRRMKPPYGLVVVVNKTRQCMAGPLWRLRSYHPRCANADGAWAVPLGLFQEHDLPLNPGIAITFPVTTFPRPPLS
ncbi:hypothetical protein N7520_005949 [Penicillium odoratum]|uniref:uncharacterized protein n=1 Tax=Penicillium odoratum TaxID=1167516 RepID=UPI002546AFB7|nr:uncharacterized protein N7520_005949 [Penicillium odoratum]KAJ5758793.1 hypothetical protein N7520_005949 [Penicillium odoratum]